jgi:hypothetical protein
MLNVNYGIEEKRNFINEVFKIYTDFKHRNQAISQTNLLEIVSKDIYPDPKRFLIEMIQNADDSSFEKGSLELNITFLKQTIIISHKGKPFDKDDILSLCTPGNSTKKKHEKLTGYKGIGFKSIFSNSDKVIVQSDGYCFRFDKSFIEKEKNKFLNSTHNESLFSSTNLSWDLSLPWQIIPIWTEEERLEEIYRRIIKDYNVNLIIFMNKEETVDECRGFIKEIMDDHMYFIFLKSKNLEFTVVDDYCPRTTLCKFESKRINIIDFFKDYQKIGSYYVDIYDVNIEQNFDKDRLELIKNNSLMPKKLTEIKHLEISFAIPIEDEGINGEIRVKSLPKEHRIIYAYLPTKVNYNFPFLINTNFTLDAGRTQLMESPWNQELFRIIPKYITLFQQNLFINFGNSFAESLTFKHNILCKMFQEVFSENMLKEKQIISDQIKIVSINNKKVKLTDCYLDLFNLNIKNYRLNSILLFFECIYQDNKSLPRRILEQYYFKNKGLSYLPDFQISEKEKGYVDLIAKYYEVNYKIISHQDVVGYLNSEEFRLYTKPYEIWRILSMLSQTNLFESIILSNDFKLPDINFEFRKPEDLLIPQVSLNTEAERSFFQEIKVEEYQKYEINPELLKIFKFNNEVIILEKLKVSVFNDDKKFLHVYNNFYSLYEKDKSIDMVRTLFKKWVDSDGPKKKEITDKFKNLKDKYLLLTKGDLFISPHCIVLGKFYKKDCPIEVDSEYFLSEEYYIENTDINDWKFFFIDIELWHEEKCFIMKVNLALFDNMPFIDQKFKNLPDVRKKLKNNKECNIYVSTKINRVYEKSIKEISDYFKDYIYLCNISLLKENVKERNFLNYFKWFFQSKPIPTNQNNLLPIEKVLSRSILEGKTDIIKKVLEKNLEFPKYEIIYVSLKDCFRREKLTAEEIILILDKLSNEEAATQADKEQISNYYLKLCQELASLKTNLIFKGKMIDWNDKLRPIQELYYISDPEIESLIGNNLSKMYSMIKMPPETSRQREFLSYFKSSNLKVYDRSSVKYNPFITFACSELDDELKRLNKYIVKLFQKNNNGELETNKIIEKLNMIKFYKCSRITIRTNWGDNFEHGICYSDIKMKSIYIYFLNDQVYTSWKHPTIIYYVTEQLSAILECRNLHAELITLFLQESNMAIEKWLELNE